MCVCVYMCVCKKERVRERGGRGRERGDRESATDVTMHQCINVYMQSLRETFCVIIFVPPSPLPFVLFIEKRLELLRIGVRK